MYPVMDEILQRAVICRPRRRIAKSLIFIVLLALLHISATAQSIRTIHVFVALADNAHQGIVPVPAKLGNGDDPFHNLYWGAAAGVKTFFARSAEWQLLPVHSQTKAAILERCIFKHRKQNVYLIADAYQGSQIQQAIMDFFSAAAGTSAEQVSVGTEAHPLTLPAAGGANLVAYVGHDGLMEFQLSNPPQKQNTMRPQAIVLACTSKVFFADPMRASGAYPLLWTTGLMAPEAYTLKSAVDGWILHEGNEQIRTRAAEAYDKYQKCGIKGARRLLVSGW